MARGTRGVRNGAGKGQGRPGGLRREANTGGGCTQGGPGGGQGGGRGQGTGRPNPGKGSRQGLKR